jgi:hypothetical protein
MSSYLYRKKLSAVMLNNPAKPENRLSSDNNRKDTTHVPSAVSA